MMNEDSVNILCVDDDAQIRQALQAVFDYQGWKTRMAANVPQGLEAFLAEPSDIVLMDYHLPGVNGIEGVRRLRQISSSVPIIVFTVEEDQRVADEFLQAGASDFALKPIKVPDIISRIRLHIRLMRSESRAAQLAPFIKGISPATLELVTDTLAAAGGYISAEEIVARTGLAHQTAYRYLQHLLQEGIIEAQSHYGKIGRPRQSFRLRRTEEETMTEEKKTARARAQLRRAQEAGSVKSRALSLYNGLGVLLGFDEVPRALGRCLEPEDIKRFLAYVSYYSNEGDTADTPVTLPDKATLERVQEGLVALLEEM